ncbi:MAG TPA: DUF484 family protein [Burkholderiales bacterium]|nr:DUF484 family protein [Burkholderiales bacterium]
MSEIESLSAEAIARYLEENPAFFERYADLLHRAQIPNPHGGAIALSDRQVKSLREKNRALEGKLGELIQFGEENDTTSERVHQLALAFVGANNFAEVLHALYEQMSLRLQVPYVAMRLWQGTGEGPEFWPVGPELREFAEKLEGPYCGPNHNFEAVSWFGDTAPVRSVVFMPLKDGPRAIGLLALGSEDERRFYADMGTLYLERIGELASAAVLRVL